ncbi:MAG: GAF domain-containing protein [Anaerolineaceae bacterium]|nr:GAF domain-containing protein [Anaerolineaceae bacterium]
MTHETANLSPLLTGTPQSPPTLTQRRLVFVLSWLPAAGGSLGFVVVMQQYQLEAYLLLIWAACAGLLTLYHMLAGDARYRLWTWYLSVALLISWLTMGLPLALVAALVAPPLAVALWWCCGAALDLPALPKSCLVRFVLLRSGLAVAFLLAAAGVYDVLNGSVPLVTTTETDLLALGVVFLIVALGIQVVVTAYLNQKHVFIHWRDDLLDGLIFVPIVVIVPLILYQLGYVVFLVVMLLVGLHTIRYRYIGKADRLYRQFQQKVNIVGSYASEIIPDHLDQDDMQAVCRVALAITSAERAAIFLANTDDQRLHLAASSGLTSQHEVYLAHHDWAIPESWPLMIPDFAYLPADSPYRAEAQVGDLQSLVALPLRQSGVLLGALVVYPAAYYAFPETDLSLLTILANYVASALSSTRTFKALESYALETTQLLSLSRATANLQLDDEENFKYIAATLCQLINVEWAALLLAAHGGMPSRVLGWIQVGTPETEAQPDTLLHLPELLAFDAPEGAAGIRVYRKNDPNRSAELAAFMQREGLGVITIAPMQAQTTRFGAILLGRTEERTFTTHENSLLEMAAGQIAPQLQAARFFQITHQLLNQRGKQLAAIEEIARQISGSQDFNDIIHNVLNAAIQTTQADMATLALVTETGDYWIIIEYHDDQGRIQRTSEAQEKDTGIIGRAIRTGKTLLIAQNAQDADYLHTPSGPYASSLVVPLYHGQIPLGALNVESVYPAFFTQEQASFLHNLGEHALISIENARLLEKLNYQVETLRSLRELSLFLSSAADTHSVARAVLGAAMAILHSQTAALFQRQPAHAGLVSLWSAGVEDGTADAEVMNQVAQQAVLSGEIQEIPDVASHPDLVAGREVTNRGIIAVPIMREDQVSEVLSVAFAEPHFFQDRDVSTLSWLASQTARHLENAMLHERIRGASSRMRAILDTTRDGVVLLNRDGNLTELNPAAEKLLGITLGDYRDARFADLLDRAEIRQPESAGYSAEELTNLARIIRLEPGRIIRREFERQVRPNEVIHIQEIGSPVFDEHSNVQGWLLILRDITEEKALEIYRNEITHMIVHDLRGPLASIVSGVRIAEDNLPDTNETDLIRTTLGLSRKSAEDLMELVNTILDIAKLENKQMPLTQEPYPVSNLFQQAYESLLPALQKSDITVSFVVAEGLPLAQVDARLMQRVLVNLLENARRFTPSGGQIQFSAEQQTRRRLIIRVADTGPGIPANEREHIFEKYRQIRGSQPQRGGKGTGLGLTFCKLVVEAHNGRIWVEDEGPLSGACFALTLPVA